MLQKPENTRAKRSKFIGQDFDEFLKAEGINAEVEARALKKVAMADTRVRHVTKRGVNLFAELGFQPVEAQRLHEQSKKQINQAPALTGKRRRSELT